MPGEKNVETSELMTPGPVSDAPLELSDRDMGKDSVPSDSFSSVSAVGDAMSGTKVVNQSSALEHGVYYPPTSCYDYCYPGYSSTFPLLDDKNCYNTAGGSYILGSGFQSTGHEKGIRPVSKFLSFKNQNPGAFMRYGSVNYQSNGRVWKNNYKYKSPESLGRNVGAEASTELTRGPRSNMKNPKLPEVERAELAIETDKYNLHDFQIEYDNAKFYVIKSFSEDDVHKCIKYNVWSSTSNGNRKLDAAFHEADAQASQTGKKCPVFLFFSVNGSGQFVGVAEMIGQVDFGKNMDFWQLDKWTGFFPIKWHIIKDMPNTLLRHIILENNEDRSVTFSRDTQEIGLKQGLEMLSIFKSYSGRTSILDDFNFYENREKSLRAKREAKPASQTNVFKNGDYKKHAEAGGGITGTGTSQSDPSSLITLAENLSLNSQPVESSI